MAGHRREPELVRACTLVKNFEAATENAITIGYTSVVTELKTMATKDTQQDEEVSPFKTAHNNPREAAKFRKELDQLTDKFMDEILGFDRYKQENAYEQYVHDVYTILIDGSRWGHARCTPMGPNSFDFAYIFAKKCPHWGSAPLQWVHAPLWEILDPPLILSKLNHDDFKHASVQTMLDLVEDKRCTAYLNKPIDDRKNIKKRQSTDPPLSVQTLEGLSNRTTPSSCVAPFILKGHMTCHMCI